MDTFHLRFGALLSGLYPSDRLTFRLRAAPWNDFSTGLFLDQCDFAFDFESHPLPNLTLSINSQSTTSTQRTPTSRTLLVKNLLFLDPHILTAYRHGAGVIPASSLLNVVDGEGVGTGIVVDSGPGRHWDQN